MLGGWQRRDGLMVLAISALYVLRKKSRCPCRAMLMNLDRANGRDNLPESPHSPIIAFSPTGASGIFAERSGQ